MARFGMFSRRDCFRLAMAGGVGASLSGWLGRLAAATEGRPPRSCILLWMSGGPSQTDTFDLKPGHANGGPFKEIATSVPGIRISEHLPKVAAQMHRMALIRSISTKEADHGRASYLLHTGRVPGTPVQYPAFGAVVAKELARDDAVLPGFVSIAPYRFLNPAGPGFLGPSYAPLVIGDDSNIGRMMLSDEAAIERALKVPDLDAPTDLTRERSIARGQLLSDMEAGFTSDRAGSIATAHRTAYVRAVNLMQSSVGKTFDLSSEPAALRDAYGRNLFGQGCLLARRLVERGVPFVEVTLNGVPGTPGLGWDTHSNNFDSVAKLCEVLDPAWATLMNDLQARGLLDNTLIVWMGEFGRTPQISRSNGRDHWATGWTTVLAGGGIKGGQAIGDTGPDGMTLKSKPVGVPDLLATVGTALGLDVRKQNTSNVGRPIRLVEPTAQAIEELLA